MFLARSATVLTRCPLASLTLSPYLPQGSTYLSEEQIGYSASRPSSLNPPPSTPLHGQIHPTHPHSMVNIAMWGFHVSITTTSYLLLMSLYFVALTGSTFKRAHFLPKLSKVLRTPKKSKSSFEKRARQMEE
jgi:hypothetical protein